MSAMAQIIKFVPETVSWGQLNVRTKVVRG